MTRVTLWGTRGSLAAPGPETARYGGNTSCVEVRGAEGSVLVLDAGTGIRKLGTMLASSVRRVDLLLTHLHMDHIQGLGFFAPLFDPEVEVHIWGPASTTLSLQARLSRYLSPPLFPVWLRDLPSAVAFHEVPARDVAEVGEFRISAALVCHPGPTVGYRIETSEVTLAYVPDHEPALGARRFPASRDWTSGYDLVADVDLLIHDAQYTAIEYPNHVGWGHSSLSQALKFADLAGVKSLVPFHHDPTHDDVVLDRLFAEALALAGPSCQLRPGTEGSTFEF